MKGLIIDEPWISRILDGTKTWEMRSKHTSQRGQIALILKGSGQIVGVATLNGSTGPLHIEALRENVDRHRVPIIEFETGRAMKWTTAWLLSGARALTKSVPYRHPFGAVTWVNLDPAVDSMIKEQLAGIDIEAVNFTEPAIECPPANVAQSLRFSIDPDSFVPVSSDGSWFGPHLLRSGQFTVGAKGEEIRVDTYEQALLDLASMDAARWRRPNLKGNWGIVTGVRWIKACEIFHTAAE